VFRAKLKTAGRMIEAVFMPDDHATQYQRPEYRSIILTVMQM